jgi:nucleoside-diphosphate-sugar epimerase
MNILITGANGYVGKTLVPKLLKEGHELLEITISPELSRETFGDSISQFHYIEGKQDELVLAIGVFKPEVVLHLASFLTANDDYNTIQKLLQANINFLCSILDAVKNVGIKWFINTGSCAEYFKGDGILDPAYFYTATKSASRIFVDYYSKTYDFSFCTVVPYTIYGGSESQRKIIDILYDSLNCDTALDLTPGDQVLDFIHVDDVTEFFKVLVSCLDDVPTGANFQLGKGAGTTLKELVSMMEKATGKTANINWGGKQYRKRDVMYAVANPSLQYHLLRWQPKVMIQDGVSDYLKAKQKLSQK